MLATPDKTPETQMPKVKDAVAICPHTAKINEILSGDKICAHRCMSVYTATLPTDSSLPQMAWEESRWHSRDTAVVQKGNFPSK